MKFTINKKHHNKAYIKNLNKRVTTIKTEFLKLAYQKLLFYTPVKTGYLKSRYFLDLYNYSINNDCSYIYYVNNGTFKQAGKHFIEISFLQALREFNNIVNKAKE